MYLFTIEENAQDTKCRMQVEGIKVLSVSPKSPAISFSVLRFLQGARMWIFLKESLRKRPSFQLNLGICPRIEYHFIIQTPSPQSLLTPKPLSVSIKPLTSTILPSSSISHPSQWQQNVLTRSSPTSLPPKAGSPPCASLLPPPLLRHNTNDLAAPRRMQMM